MKITVYTLPVCVQCGMTKRRLDAKELPYDVVDLTQDEASADRFRELGLLQAPIVEVAVDGETPVVFSGFRPDLIDELATTGRLA